MSPGNLSPRELPLRLPLVLSTVLSSVLFRPGTALFEYPEKADCLYEEFAKGFDG